MMDDPIRNIQFNTSKSIFSVKGPNDRPFHKEKRKKKLERKRKKDSVELTEEPLSKIITHESKTKHVQSKDVNKKQIHIDIIAK